MLLGAFIFCCQVFHLGQATLTDAEIQIFLDNDFVIIDNTSSRTFQHPGIPEHGFEGGFGNNPNTPSVQNHSYEIPKVPTEVAQGSEGCVRLGAIAMSISGVPFYNPYTGGGYNAVEGECEETFDVCSGHPAPGGVYHYHKLPSCLYYNNRTDLRDVFLGVAFDGYAIYGPMDETGKNWTSGELDKCHGHVYKGRYIYRITLDFPYIMACYHGETLVDQQRGGVGGMRPPPPNGGPPPRMRREAVDDRLRVMYKRQMITTNCNQGQEANWQQETCWAFCENPSTGEFDDCMNTEAQTTTDGSPIVTTTDDGTSSSVSLRVSVFLTSLYVSVFSIVRFSTF